MANRHPKPSYLAWTDARIELLISELGGERGSARFIENQRSSQTCKIIIGPEKIGEILQEMANEPTQATLTDLYKPLEAWYGSAIQPNKNHLYQIGNYFHQSDAELWEMLGGHAADYYRAVEI